MLLLHRLRLSRAAGVHSRTFLQYKLPDEHGEKTVDMCERGAQRTLSEHVVRPQHVV